MLYGCWSGLFVSVQLMIKQSLIPKLYGFVTLLRTDV